RRVGELGMARGFRVQLAEALDLVEGHVPVAREVEPRVEEHRAVTGREDETVAVEPLRVRRAISERVAVEDGTYLRAPEGQAQVAAGAGVDGVDGEPAGGGGRLGENVVAKKGAHGSVPLVSALE